MATTQTDKVVGIGCKRGVERDKGVDKEKAPREAKMDNIIDRLGKTTACDDIQQLFVLVENYFEPN